MQSIIHDESIFGNMSHSLVFAIAALCFAIVSLCFLTRFLKLGLGPSALAAFVSLAVAVIFGYVTYRQNSSLLTEFLSQGHEMLLTLSVNRGFLAFFAIPFLVRLGVLWVNPEERSPQALLNRGWMRILDWTYALFISLAAAFGSVCSFQLIFPALALVLILPRLIHILMNTPTPASHAETASPADPRAAERAKVIALLEQGKITVEESADLLAALGTTRAPAPSPNANNLLSRRLIIIGAVVLVAGFFLPWFSINPLLELQRLAGQFPFAMSGTNHDPETPLPGSFSPGTFPLTIDVNGPKIGKGLGWMILFLGLAAAAIPFCFAGLQSRISIVPLSVGVLMLLYLCSEAFRSINYGFVMVSLGYVLLGIGLFKWPQQPDPAIRS